MKKIKYLLAFVIVISMLSSVAMAMSLGVDGATGTTINYEEGNLVLTIKPSETTSVFGIGVTVYFDGTVWENKDANAASSSAYAGGMSGAQNAGTADASVTYTNTGYMGDITPDAALVTFTFALRSGQVANGTTFRVESSCIDGIGFVDVVGGETTYTVKTAAPKTPYAISESINTNATIKGAENTYTGVWVGTYTVTPNDDVVTGITINGETINKVLGEGQGNIVFKVASIATSEATPTVTVNVQ